MAKTIEITAIEPFGGGKVGWATYTTADGKSGKAKVFVNDFKVGPLEAEFEKKAPYGKDDAPESDYETWIKSPPKGGGGFKGGGGAKADPERIAIEKDRLAHEKAKSANIDKHMELREASIPAQVILKLAVENCGGDLTQARGIALTLAEIYNETIDAVSRPRC